MEVQSYPHGVPSWVDLSTTDQDAAKSFYGEMFGWSWDDRPAGPGRIYSMAKLETHDIAAVSALPPDQAANGVPPHWNSYITVDNADEVVARIDGLGGTVIMPAFDVMDSGRMAVIADPTGAVFMLWQANAHCGATRVNEANTYCWNELYTNDLEASKAFYNALLGWTFTSMGEGASHQLHSISIGERGIGTMMLIEEDWGPMPPTWGVYFAVADVDAFFEKSQTLGAKPYLPIQSIPGVGRFGGLQDPQGAHFLVIQLDQEG